MWDYDDDSSDIPDLDDGIYGDPQSDDPEDWGPLF